MSIVPVVDPRRRGPAGLWTRVAIAAIVAVSLPLGLSVAVSRVVSLAFFGLFSPSAPAAIGQGANSFLQTRFGEQVLNVIAHNIEATLVLAFVLVLVPITGVIWAVMTVMDLIFGYGGLAPARGLLLTVIPAAGGAVELYWLLIQASSLVRPTTPLPIPVLVSLPVTFLATAVLAWALYRRRPRLARQT